MKKPGALLLLTGLLLVAFSFYPLFLIFRELIFDYYVNQKYKIEEVITYSDPTKYEAWYKEPIRFKNQVIEISDQGKSLPSIERDWADVNETRVRGPVTIKINGQDLAWPTEVIIRPDTYSPNRYWGWLNLIQVNDEIAIIQRISRIQQKGQNTFLNDTNEKWRILYVNEQGGIREDIFTYPERDNPPIRAKIVQRTTVSSSPVGYKSEILHVWPTVFFPLLYPFVTGIIGTILFVVGVLKRKRSANV